MARRQGLTVCEINGSGEPVGWRYRDPEVRHRHALISYSGYQFSVVAGEYAFDVWLYTKRKPKVHVVIGDLLDALAKAAEIIHAPTRSAR